MKKLLKKSFTLHTHGGVWVEDMFGNQTFFDKLFYREGMYPRYTRGLPRSTAVFKYWYYWQPRFSIAVPEIKFDRFVLDYDYRSACIVQKGAPRRRDTSMHSWYVITLHWNTTKHTITKDVEEQQNALKTSFCLFLFNIWNNNTLSNHQCNVIWCTVLSFTHKQDLFCVF